MTLGNTDGIIVILKTVEIAVIFEGISHLYDERVVLKNIQHAFVGGCLAVIGPNGSGKSTLLKIASGLLTPTSGSCIVRVDGVDVDKSRLRTHVGYSSPDARLWPEMSVYENLEFLLRLRSGGGGKSQVRDVISILGLEERAEDAVGTLSSGLKQRANIAAALVHNPPVLILDEPGTNLDEAGRAMVNAIIKQHKGCVIIATNSPEEAALADDVIELTGGCG